MQQIGTRKRTLTFSMTIFLMPISPTVLLLHYLLRLQYQNAILKGSIQSATINNEMTSVKYLYNIIITLHHVV
jgi:hypothetical protein